MITIRELFATTNKYFNSRWRQKVLRWVPKAFQIGSDNCHATWQTQRLACCRAYQMIDMNSN